MSAPRGSSPAPSPWRLGFPARIASGIAVILAAALYGAPVVALWNATGRSLAPWVSPDTYLYLNISQLQADSLGLVRNPWYGNLLPAHDVAYLRFGVAARLFHVLSAVTGDDGTALIAWHVCLVLAIGVTLIWMLSAVTRDAWVLVAAFAALMFVDARFARDDVAQFGKADAAWIYGLPFARTFFPQCAVPLLFASLGAMLRWIADRRAGWLIAIAVMQLIAFFVFPYSAIVIAGGVAAIAMAALALRAIAGRDLAAVVLTVVAALGLDAGAYLMAGRGLQVPGIARPFAFDLSQLSVDRTVVLPLVLGLMALAAGGVDRRVRAALGGFAIGVALMPLLDAFVSPTLQLGHHIAYFYTVAFWLPLVAIGLGIATRVRPAVTRAVAAVVTAAMVIFAMLDVRATTTMWHAYNRDNGELARALGALGARDGDLVIAPVHGFRTARSPVYWEASWVPLVSSATVLYAGAAQFLLPRGSPERGERLATYLFLAGEDVRSLGAILAAPTATNAQHFVAGYGREFLLHTAAREATLAEIRQELDAPLAALERGDAPRFLRAARRVIVADYRDAPVLHADRVGRLFAVDRVVDAGVWRLRIASPAD